MSAAFPDRLKEARDQSGHTWQELATETGIHIATLLRYANGDAEPTLSKLVRIAEALDVSLDQLAGRTIQSSQ